MMVYILFLGMNKQSDLLKEGIIEIAPLAYMRGRTLEDAFVILDEAQNTTHAQNENVFNKTRFWLKNGSYW